jgi:hypothetical protein
MNDYKRWLLVLLVAFCAPLAAKKPEPAIQKADTPEKFEIVSNAIRQEMAPGKRYEFLNAYNRRVVEDSLDHMQSMLTKAGSVDAMSQEEKTELFSYQEKANGILARNADDRLVCTHASPTGSHIPMTTCHTVRELASSRRKSRDQFQDISDKANAAYTSEARPGGG